MISRPAAAILALILASLAAVPSAAQSRQSSQEAADLEAKIGELLLSTSGHFDPARYGAALRDISARLGNEEPAIEWDEGERLKLADGSPVEIKVYRIQISGTAPFAQAYLFFDSLFYGGSAGVKLEKLRLEAVPGNQVSYAATYAVAHTAQVPASEAAPAQTERRRQTVALLEELAKDSQSHSLLDSLAALTAALDAGSYGESQRRAVGLGRLELAGAEGKVEGVALGKSAEAALGEAFAGAGFARFEVEMRAPAGGCRPFAATFVPGRAPEEEYRVDSPNGLFDAGIAELCGPPAGESKKIVVAGKAGEEGIDLDLRGAGTLDALAWLAELLQEPFLAAPGIPTGRLFFDVRGATREQLFAALAQAGLEVGAQIPHWVVAAGTPLPELPEAKGGFQGAEALFDLRKGRFDEMVCSIGVLAEKQIWSTGPLAGPVHVFGNLPWDQLLAALLVPRGLVHRVDGERILIGPAPAEKLAGREDLVQLCTGEEEVEEEKPFAGSRLAEMELDEHQMALEDLQLVGLGRSGNYWVGAAYPPNRKRLHLLPNYGYFAGSTLSAGPEGISIATEDGGRQLLQLQN